MQTVTTPAGYVHAMAKQQPNGDWFTWCHRIRVGSDMGMLYNLDDPPKAPTCLWCAGQRVYL